MSRNRTAIGSVGTFLGTVNPKVVLAAALLLLMAVLWLRVFLRGRSGPAAVQAQTLPGQTANQPSGGSSAPKAVLQPLSLPVVEGRHDRLWRDPFVVERSEWFAQADNPASVDSPREGKEPSEEQRQQADLQKIAGTVLLQAVIKDPAGVPVRACVNGTVLSKGETLKVKENGKVYELKLTDIGASEVQFCYQTLSFTVKMPSSEWLD
jgi:hypothetical protein